MNYIEIIKTCAENRVKTVKIDGDAVEIEFFSENKEITPAPVVFRPEPSVDFSETAKKAFENDKNNLYNETIAALPLEDPMEYEKMIEKLGEDMLEDEEDEEI